MYDVAVVMPTIIRPQLDKAVKSVFNQDFDGRIQLLIGLDYPCGNKEDLWVLQIQAPTNVQVDVLHLGYSTRKDKGGLYYNWGGGALRTILTFAANSRYVAYLDDDCWYDPNHISSLMTLIKEGDHDWVFSKRRAIDTDTGEPIDDRTINWWGGTDTNCYLIDKVRCHKSIHGWARVEKPKRAHEGIGEDEEFSYQDEADFYQTLKKNKSHNYKGTGLTTVNYGLSPDSPSYELCMKKAGLT